MYITCGSQATFGRLEPSSKNSIQQEWVMDIIEHAARGNYGVRVCITESVCLLGEPAVRFFLGTTTERGEELWLRFKAFKSDKKEDVTFVDFVKANIPHYLTVSLKEVAEAHTLDTRGWRKCVGTIFGAARFPGREGWLFPYGFLLARSLGIGEERMSIPGRDTGPMSLASEFAGRYRRALRNLERSDTDAIRYALCVVDRILGGRDIHESRVRAEVDVGYQRFGHGEKLYAEHLVQGGIPLIPGKTSPLQVVQSINFKPHVLRSFEATWQSRR